MVIDYLLSLCLPELIIFAMEYLYLSGYFIFIYMKSHSFIHRSFKYSAFVYKKSLTEKC